MNTLQKKRTIIAIIIFLLLLNISAISTIVYHKIQYNDIRNNSEQYNSGNRNIRNPHMRVKKFIKEELGLTDKQFESYCKLKDQNINNSQVIFEKINENKKLIIDEIKEKDPDTLLLDNFAKNIGELHAQIQLETIKHFLEVKKILNENQIEKFELLLSKMNNHQMHMRENNYSQKRNRRYKN
ncbi:MAG: hypothetical protein JXR51_16725 [Bacteroidales bacterium]|nr:hypothetical protein [Bacteroidales bacterium]MBN2758813.1 hypothetical protein [Bacteroidales bacterium]